MKHTRRQFILGTANLALAALLLPSCQRMKPEQWIVSSCDSPQGQNMAAAIRPNGDIVSTVNLPARGHDALALPQKPGHALVFCRRPGRFAVEVDFINGEIVKTFHSQTDSHFYGHGVLSQDGQYLFTTENQFDKNRGLIVVRDSQTYQVLDRFDSGGVGPHELALMPDGKTLVVANGGIQTHPSQPRKKLNLSSMQPNLAYIDLASSKVLAHYQPKDHQLSLRHLDVGADGSVFVGAQYQGHQSVIQPLLFAHHGEDNLQAFSAPDTQWHKMQQYTASLLVKDDLLCVSCPRGAHLSFWDTQTQRFSGQQKYRDVSGLALSNDTVLASSGKGLLKKLDNMQPITGPSNINTLALKFDNHMIMIASG